MTERSTPPIDGTMPRNTRRNGSVIWRSVAKGSPNQLMFWNHDSSTRTCGQKGRGGGKKNDVGGGTKTKKGKNKTKSLTRAREP